MHNVEICCSLLLFLKYFIPLNGSKYINVLYFTTLHTQLYKKQKLHDL